MMKDVLDNMESLLKNYDDLLRDKGEHIADMMADFADCSIDKVKELATRYDLNRRERQRVYMALTDIGLARIEMENRDNEVRADQ